MTEKQFNMLIKIVKSSSLYEPHVIKELLNVLKEKHRGKDNS